VIIFNDATSSVQLACSLDPIIPTTTTILWFNETSLFIPSPPNTVLENNDTTTVITIVDPQLSDEGRYQCIFADTGLFFSKIITLGQCIALYIVRQLMT